MTGTIYENNRRIVAISNPIQYKTFCCICENMLGNGQYYELRIEDNTIYTSRYLCFKCKDFLRDWLVGNG